MAQRVLAAEVTELVHGAEETDKAIAASHALFGQGNLAGLDEKTLAAALAEIPSATVGVPAGGSLPTVADLMAATGIVSSKSAARRAIAAGGAYLNNRRSPPPDAQPAETDLLHSRFLILRRGKRTVGGVEVVQG